MISFPALVRTVRVGQVSDQDRWRRDDYRRLTPEQRLGLMVQLRDLAWPEALPIQRVVTIRHLLQS